MKIRIYIVKIGKFETLKKISEYNYENQNIIKKNGKYIN